MHTRLTNVLKERTEFLKSSVDKYLIVESKTLKDLKENLLDGVGAHGKKNPNDSFHSDDDSS